MGRLATLLSVSASLLQLIEGKALLQYLGT